MPANPINVGDVVTFRVTVTDQDGSAVDVSGASTKQIKLRKPSGTVLTKTASFTTDGSDGKIEYQTANTDLDVAGVWGIQAYVVGTGYENSTRADSFRVYVKYV